jgi:Flp pilus assembly protein TadD
MRIVTFFAIAILCSSLRADILILKDGTRVEGDLKHTDGGYDVTDADGKTTHVSQFDVQSIQLGKSSGSLSAMDKFESLKRSVDSMDDINKIIARFNDFIAQNKNTPAAVQAQKELAVWQQRLDQQMVKVAGKWVTSDQRDQMVAQSGDIIKQAFELMKENKLKEATPELKQAMAIDPTNPVANYLLGVLYFRDDNIQQARKSFELVHQQIPSDPATLNNLAVCAWRQNQFVVSLGFYCDAMLAMPSNKEIVNNVAEALYALKDDFKKNPTAQRASRLFITQEAQLETTMAQYGWYRWGATWLDQNQLNELKAAQKEVKDKIDRVQQEFDDTRKKIQDNDDRMVKDQDFMTDVQNSMAGYVDPNTGIALRNPYPNSYYDADREILRLQQENQQLNHQLDQYRADAKQLDASKPKPKYTGTQNLIGVEGTPKTGLIADVPAPQIPVAPASQPAPAPATAPTPAPATQQGVY